MTLGGIQLHTAAVRLPYASKRTGIPATWLVPSCNTTATSATRLPLCNGWDGKRTAMPSAIGPPKVRTTRQQYNGPMTAPAHDYALLRRTREQRHSSPSAVQVRHALVQLLGATVPICANYGVQSIPVPAHTSYDQCSCCFRCCTMAPKPASSSALRPVLARRPTTCTHALQEHGAQ